MKNFYERHWWWIWPLVIVLWLFGGGMLLVYDMHRETGSEFEEKW